MNALLATGREAGSRAGGFGQPMLPPSAGAEDAHWVRRAVAGDPAAFECLYRRHASTILGLCRRLCDGDPRRAEQAAQDAFVRAWEKLDSFRGDSAFGTWMHRLTVNVVLGERRLLQRWTSFEDVLEETPAPAYDPARLDLETAIAKLPKGARSVLILHDVEGYRHEEIAELTGIAVGTSKAQLHRARQLMRSYLI
jgi:RNA polymerase sigma-70 factor (ECF subfamily)